MRLGELILLFSGIYVLCAAGVWLSRRHINSSSPPHQVTKLPWETDWYGPGTVAEQAAAAADYKVFTHEFDELVDALALASAKDLKRRQNLLDKQLADPSATSAHRLAKRIADALADGDTAVMLLLDNSGSMRRPPGIGPDDKYSMGHGIDMQPLSSAAMLATFVHPIVKSCAKLDVPIEVLGFTTPRWKGGNARERWLTLGKDANPGRLNDLRHIIYKSFDQSLLSDPKRFAQLMDERLFKENIDGEAIAWAYSRIMKRPERRRIIAVISDGAPVDDSTLVTNDGGYLERHIRAVIAEIAKRGDVELFGIGIGFDVDRYYAKQVKLANLDALQNPTTADAVVALFAASNRDAAAPHPRM